MDWHIIDADTFESELAATTLESCEAFIDKFGLSQAQKWRATSPSGWPVFVKAPTAQDGARYELAAWRAARVFGLEDLVAPVVRHPSERVLTPWFENATEDPCVTHFSDDVRWRAAIFDAIVRQPDRITSHGNWLGVTAPDGTLRLKLIDHERAFNLGYPPNKPLECSAFQHGLRHQPLPPEIADEFRDTTRHQELLACVDGLLAKRDKTALIARLHLLHNANQLADIGDPLGL